MESAIFLFTRRVLAFFRVNPAKKVLPNLFIRSACFVPLSGQPRVNPGKQERGARKKIKKSASFLFEVSCSQRRLSEGPGSVLDELGLAISPNSTEHQDLGSADRLDYCVPYCRSIVCLGLTHTTQGWRARVKSDKNETHS